MALTAKQQELFNTAKGSLPKFYFTDDNNPQEMLAGQAKIIGSAWEQVAQWVSDTYLTQASSDALNQHARDRGTDRQLNEDDVSLVTRLRSPTDAITLPSITAAINTILANAGITSECAIVEGRLNRAFNATGPGKIQAIPRARIVAGETLLVTAGVTTTLTFDASGTAPPNSIDISSAVSAADVAAAIADAISSYATNLDGQVSSDDNTVVVVTAESDVFSLVMSETVTDPGFTVVTQPCGAYCDNGYRLDNDSSMFIVILPYGTPANVIGSITEALRQRKAAGIFAIIETRLVP